MSEMTATEFEPAGSAEPTLDRFNRYMLPDPAGGSKFAWTRATTLARTLTDEYNLNEWRNRMVVHGIGLRTDLYALAAATDSDDRETLQRVANDAMAAAQAGAGANVGTALHSFTTRLDMGVPVNVPDTLRNHIGAYQTALDAHGFKPLPSLMERVCVCPEIKVAGKFDRILYGANTVGVVADLKTAKFDSLQYAWLEMAIQLACYANASHIWDVGSQAYIPMPAVDKNWAIIIHVPNDARPAVAQWYELDIAAGWRYAQLAMEVRAARSTAKKLGRPMSRPVSVTTDLRRTDPASADELVVTAAPAADGSLAARIEAATTVAELGALWREGTAAGTWTAAHTTAGHARQRALQRAAKHV